jgi:hypothetical protein
VDRRNFVRCIGLALGALPFLGSAPAPADKHEPTAKSIGRSSIDLHRALRKLEPELPGMSRWAWTGYKPRFLDLGGQIVWPIYGDSGGITSSVIIYIMAAHEQDIVHGHAYRSVFEISYDRLHILTEDELRKIVHDAVKELDKAYLDKHLLVCTCGGDLGRAPEHLRHM